MLLESYVNKIYICIAMNFYFTKALYCIVNVLQHLLLYIVLLTLALVVTLYYIIIFP